MLRQELKTFLFRSSFQWLTSAGCLSILALYSVFADNVKCPCNVLFMTVSSVRDGVTLIYAFLIIIIITRVIHPTLQDILEHYRQQIRFGITQEHHQWTQAAMKMSRWYLKQFKSFRVIRRSKYIQTRHHNHFKPNCSRHIVACGCTIKLQSLHEIRQFPIHTGTQNYNTHNHYAALQPYLEFGSPRITMTTHEKFFFSICSIWFFGC